MRTLAAAPLRLVRRLVRIAVVTLVLVGLYAVLDALLLPGEPRGRRSA
jgi:hypothetical protein